MKLHILMMGEPKLAYAKLGFQEYVKRLGRFHDVRVTHLADKYAADSDKIAQAIGTAYTVALVIKGETAFSSQTLADFLDRQALLAKPVCFVIGGPDGLPAAIIGRADVRWSMGRLTFPHDLAVLILAEALYRASSINAGLPYHRA